MRTGDVVGMKTCQITVQDGAGWIRYKAPTGKHFVLLLLGVEDYKADGIKLDPSLALNHLGWQPIPEKEKE